MHSNASKTLSDFEEFRKLSTERRIEALLGKWPNKWVVVRDVLREMPKGTKLTHWALFRWGGRGIPARWMIPLLRAADRRHGLIPIRLSKVPAARRAAVLTKLRELYGLSIDWSAIEPMLADRQPSKEPKNGDS